MRLHHLYPSPNLWLCPGPLQLCLVLLCLLQRSVQPDLQCVVTACCLLLSSLHTTHLLRCSRGGRGGGEGERREEGGERGGMGGGREGEEGGGVYTPTCKHQKLNDHSLPLRCPTFPPSFLPTFLSATSWASSPSHLLFRLSATCLYLSVCVWCGVCVCVCVFVCVCVCVCVWVREVKHGNSISLPMALCTQTICLRQPKCSR